MMNESLFFHVARNGNDDNPGTEQAPLATLAGARDAVRSLDQDAPVHVLVHEGIAISRIDPEEATKIWETLEAMDLAELPAEP